MEPIYENVNLQREYSKYLWDLRHWPIFRVLQPDIKYYIHMVMVFGNANTKSALIVTKEKKVYAIGNNSVGQLGSKLSRNKSTVIKPREIQELRNINIKTIVTMQYSVFAITKKGKVFVWGDNSYGLLGLGKNAKKYVYEPTLLTNLCMIHIVDISCSTEFVLALTKDGIVYAWGFARNFQTYVPMKVKLEWKIDQIACNSFNVIVTTDGNVYTWDTTQMHIQHNRIRTKWNRMFFGLENVSPINIKIVKIACGRSHALALTRKGTLYAWGDNTLGFLGLGHDKPLAEFPDLVKLENVLDIAVLPETNLSAAICKDKRVYVWGQCYGLEIKIPLATSFSNIHEAFAYSFLGCMHEPLVIFTNTDSEKDTKKKKPESPTFDTYKLDSFDFKLRIDEKSIYLKKDVLKNRCQYFQSFKESDWKEKNVVLLGQFSYVVYKAFFKYLYTGRIDLSLEKIFDLLTLAKMYEAEDLLRDIEQMIMREITALKASTTGDRVKVE